MKEIKAPKPLFNHKTGDYCRDSGKKPQTREGPTVGRNTKSHTGNGQYAYGTQRSDGSH
ncbi:MAG: hypothetical protein SPG55_01575 [Prevotella sp.]|nr:hypothetical protein [Prevotella sp.]MDD7028655.1 hypothetical protein [Prevotellaceae bacterium]MDD7075889.1 hypothetical protein [Prevotellaceae bacterium]MDY5208678.1 hypothetical protein [Prevotella sp.]MDY5342888.1 hypothetical protein [Prevotella sp.]